MAADLCGVTWCVALAMTAAERRACEIPNLRRGYCAVHAQTVFRELRPALLDPGEELIDGSFGDCECVHKVFNAKTGTSEVVRGECADCGGSGTCGDECDHGHRCEHECETCDGSGECQKCGGSGFGGVRIRKPDEQAA